MTAEHIAALKTVSRAEEILDVMHAMPQGDMAVLWNEATGDLTFLGRRQIHDNAALYEDALTGGSMPIAFFSIDFDSPDGPDVDSKVVAWCPFSHAELKAQISAFCGSLGTAPEQAN